MFKQALSTVDWLLKLKTDAEVHNKTIELKLQIFSMIETIEKLTKENKSLEKKYTDAVTKIKKLDNYILVKLGVGIFAYIPKGKTDYPEESPWYCTNCYDNFQRLSLMNQDIDEWYTCPNCKNAFQYRMKSGKSGLQSGGKSIANELDNW